MKTIVVVEDLHASRRAIVNALARNGHTALEAADGVEALGLFDGRTIDLLITELKMPNLNGVGLIEKIQNMAGYQRIPVLVLSSELSDNKRDDSCAHITARVTKPFDLERFVKLVETLLK